MEKTNPSEDFSDLPEATGEKELRGILPKVI